MALLLGEDEVRLPALARLALRGIAAELEALGKRVEEVEAAILAWHKEEEVSRRLAAVPGIGPITASALVATVTDPSQFRSARQFAAWIGLVPQAEAAAGASSGRAASPSRATATCAACWCSAPPR